MSTGSILEAYVRDVPSVQNALDIFKGEWASRFPAAFSASLQAGSTPLFEDDRLFWAINQLGGVEGKRVLEMGPLEGGHSYIMELYGASSVIAIEANTRAYLKCLIAKELLQMKRVKYLCGDFVEYLKAEPQQFDLILASGVLYHMRNPVELLTLLANHTNQVYLWTHYFDSSIATNPRLGHKFSTHVSSEEAGFKHTLHRFEYQASLDLPGFCGGSEEYSNWLDRNDLLNCLSHLGFRDVRVGLEQTDHPNGPCLAIVATK